MIENLTEEELALLTPYDCAAFDLHRIQSNERGEIPPVWLCMSDESREEIREEFYKWGIQHGLWYDFMPQEMAAKILSQNVEVAKRTKLWQESEAAFKKAREEGNPRAYFVK